MSINKLNRASVSSINSPSNGRINGSHFVQDQNQPRVNDISAGSKSGGRPQNRVSQAGGLHPRGTNANQPTHHMQAFGSHRAPSQKDGSGVPGRAREPEPNFLDLALGDSEEDSDNGDEWEEVACPANAVVDRPLVAASSGFTLPIRGRRSDFLTLEVVEDWQPLSLPPTPHANDMCMAPHEGLDHRLIRDLAGGQDDFPEADLQSEAELVEGLVNLNTPAPGLSRQPRSCIPNSDNGAANTSPPARPPTHLELEVVEQPLSTCTSVKGKGKVVDHESAERPCKIGERVDPLRLSSAIGDQPTRKPTVSFKKKAAELARSTGRLLAPSKPLPLRDPTAIPSSTTRGPSPTPNNPSPTPNNPSPTPNNPSRPRTQVTSDSSRPTSQLFTPKCFLSQVQGLREKQTEATLRQFNKRYGGIIVEHARRDLTDLMSTFTHTRSSDTSEGTQPIKRRQVQRTADGKRMSKAQAQAEEVMKICRSTKSYIVDLAAIAQREAATLPAEHRRPTPTLAPPSIPPPPVRLEKVTPGIASQNISKTQSVGSSPTQQLPSTSLGIVPQGLKFSRRQKPPEPGEIVAETARRVVSSEQSVRGPRLASTSRSNGLRTVDASKRRWENLGRKSEGSSSRKKPRLGPS